jgi:hypothetical protein
MIDYKLIINGVEPEFLARFFPVFRRLDHRHIAFHLLEDLLDFRRDCGLSS